MFENIEEDVQDITDVKPKYEDGKRVSQRGDQMMWLARGSGMVRLKPFFFSRVLEGRIYTLIRFENMVTREVTITESSKDKIHPSEVFWFDEQLKNDVSSCMDTLVEFKNKSRMMMAQRGKQRLTDSDLQDRPPKRGEDMMWKTRIKEGFFIFRPVKFAKLSGSKVVVLVEGAPPTPEDRKFESAKDNIQKSDVYVLDTVLVVSVAEAGVKVHESKLAARQLIVDRAVRVWPEISRDDQTDLFKDEDDD